MASNLTNNLRIAIERAGRIVCHVPHGTCVWSEARDLLDELEDALDEAETIQTKLSNLKEPP